jgi:hypothetical protein
VIQPFRIERLFWGIGQSALLIRNLLYEGTQFLHIFVIDLRVLEIRCRLCPIKAIVDMIRKDTGTNFGV